MIRDAGSAAVAIPEFDHPLHIFIEKQIFLIHLLPVIMSMVLRVQFYSNESCHRKQYLEIK